jgi:phosphoglucomutase/phosphomannomutase
MYDFLLNALQPSTKNNVSAWLKGNYPENIKQTILKLLKENPQQIENAFFTHLSFGTGGIRGLMGIGTNRMNIFTVRAAAQGLMNYISKQEGMDFKDGIFIGYDTRHHAREFAEETAKVCAGNGIKAYLCQDFCPTPMVSYGIRHWNCQAGVMITASHNPPEYSGFKVYWSDGGQVLFPYDQAIISEISKVSCPEQVKILPSLEDSLIIHVGGEIDQAYLKDILSLQHYPLDNQKSGGQLKIIYTSLHGVGIKIVPEALQSWGFDQVQCVKSQAIPDGSFPTIKSPNPEDAAALQLGVEDLLQERADLLIATDPDADRMGIVVRHENQAVILSGHQIAVIILEHICKALTKRNSLPTMAAFIKTIGTTELFQAICDDYHRPCINVLTGFKYIAEKIQLWEKSKMGHEYLFGCEESLGYLYGSFVRDKDAVLASCLISEIALQAKLEKKTLIDQLNELYAKYGFYQEKSCSILFTETKEDHEIIKKQMDHLRQCGIAELASIPILIIEDYQNLIRLNLSTGKTEKLEMPRSNVLLYWLKDGSKVIVRPSGTEPKIKLTCGVVEKNYQDLNQARATCLKRCDALLEDLRSRLNKH